MAAPLGFAASALATGGERPTIEATTAKAYEHEGTIEARIDPEGSETTYEIWLECRGAHEPTWPCEQRVEGHLAAGFEAKPVSLHLTGLQEGTYYEYGVVATNSAGQTKENGVNILLDPVIPPGACPDGCPSISPYESKISQETNEVTARYAAEAPAREAARQQAAKEQAEREAALAKSGQPSAATTTSSSSSAASESGGVSLGGTSIAVGRDGAALVKLSCFGIESCRGKLTLTAKVKKSHSPSIGTIAFSIAGDETKAVKVNLNPAGRALLKTDHGRCGASLAILELAPGAANTQTKTVHLVQQAAKAKKS